MYSVIFFVRCRIAFTDTLAVNRPFLDFFILKATEKMGTKNVCDACVSADQKIGSANCLMSWHNKLHFVILFLTIHITDICEVMYHYRRAIEADNRIFIGLLLLSKTIYWRTQKLARTVCSSCADSR